ncbi:MAG: nascent polypeptide-associated complex protein [Nitrososphaeria archaeon]|nr:nascent polypeptide-associated complex protein [Nitrososphaeria archaeon]
MDRLGLNMKEIPGVEEVIIHTVEKEIVIKNPTVSQVVAQGLQIYQIMGGIVEERQISKSYSEEDVLLVAQQAGVSKEVARAALEETNGDLAMAILKLTTK